MRLQLVCIHVAVICLVLSREWGNGYGDYYRGLYTDYCRDPFPDSPQSTRQSQSLLTAAAAAARRRRPPPPPTLPLLLLLLLVPCGSGMHTGVTKS